MMKSNVRVFLEIIRDTVMLNPAFWCDVALLLSLVFYMAALYAAAVR